ncbi:phosphoglucosamine mutase [Pyrococcus furiosus DSM 3638]|uniref:Phosphoglucosamine mutase n=3 Tax=Pyrococcus furiosus TaxID=2261 RepID=A0A5C0XR22_PYRFU|nr:MULTISPECIES: phosphoglucosamine mutase [Pyrococcus]AAL80712.1 phospho-sugar mutase [Pyrococcus furiosus DSM 3638]AFN03381.1 bifunctional phosphomannomutase/phosphoglucomutase [Pyrococcus furiosus COM1]MDK2870321.1 phosphomannomutase / phosphoglucomutase [Pyrococcus sp.]QEK78294.1 phosphoglucosamine mutase [Pyrococcus furiosus DSM 3638]
MGKLFGTFGVRGTANKDITPEFALKIGMAFGTLLRREGKKKPVVVVGRDTRVSGEMLKSALISGLLSVGCDVIDVGIAPTPAIQWATNHLKADGGAVITASHNPPEYNGIKLLEPNGMGLKKEREAIVEEIFFKEDFDRVEWHEIGEVREVDIIKPYIEAIKSKVDVEAIKKRRPFVVVDTSNGAGSLTLPYLLRELGCKVVSVNAHPDGHFPARNPEPNEENLKGFMEIVKALGADFGVAQDGDADRAVFIDENGRFIQGDKTFALVADAVLRENGGGLLVTTVATSNLLDDIAKKHGAKVMRTKVGDLIVARALYENNGTIGGEENGGVIFPDHVLGRDGAMTVAKVVEIFAKSGKKFSELIDELPKYYQIKTKRHVEGDRYAIVNKVAEMARERGYTVDTTDGAKIIFEDGWVLVRASGTEPIIRIFSEAKSEEKAQEYLDLGIELLEKALS